MSRSRIARLAFLALVVAVGSAPAACGGTAAATARLTKREMELIFNSIEICSSLETSLTQMNKEIRNIKRLAAGRSEAVDYIVRTGLRHREAHARLASVEALALIAHQRALAPLNEMVEFDDNYTVRRYAARAIVGFGDEVALKKLLREIPDFDGRLRDRLRPTKPSETSTLQERTRFREKRKRFQDLGHTLSRALNRFESLIKRMAANVDPHEQEKAKRELQRLTGDANRDSPKAWQNWWKQRKGIPPKLHRDVNRTADRTTMMTLIEIAAMIKSRPSLDGLIAALSHGDTSVKMAAAAALGELAGPKASSADASDSLNARESARVIQALQKATHEPNGWVKASAAAGLANCESKASIPDFKRLLLDWAPTDKSARHAAMLTRVRRAAVKGLAAAASLNSSRELSALLLEPRGDRLLNWETTIVLGNYGAPACLPALAHFAARGTRHETKHALAAIGKVLHRAAADARFDLREQTEAQLKTLAKAKDVPQAVAAVYESNRRGYLSASTYLRDLRSAPAEARMLALALLATANWVPALREFAVTAYSARKDAVVVHIACRAARRVCAASSIKAYLQDTPAGPDKLSAQQVTELRRAASVVLLGLLQDEKVTPSSAAAVIDALPTVLPRGEPMLRNQALAALVNAIGRESLRTKRSDLGAALRQLSGEDYPDEPRFWQHWWKNYQRKPGNARGPLGTEDEGLQRN